MSTKLSNHINLIIFNNKEFIALRVLGSDWTKFYTSKNGYEWHDIGMSQHISNLIFINNEYYVYDANSYSVYRFDRDSLKKTRQVEWKTLTKGQSIHHIKYIKDKHICFYAVINGYLSEIDDHNIYISKNLKTFKELICQDEIRNTGDNKTRRLYISFANDMLFINDYSCKIIP